MRTSTLKSVAALAITGAGSALVIGFRTPELTPLGSTTTTATSATSATGASTTTAASATSSGTASSTSVAAGAASSTSPTATASPAATATAATTYADGTWTGEAVPEPWGTFQVEAVVSGGQLTDVVLVSAPTDGHSSRINSQAVPTLTQAAIAAQGASIDMVSGATWTSESYITSLQAALDQAQSAQQAAA